MNELLDISCEKFRPSEESIAAKRAELEAKVKSDSFKFFEANVIIDIELKNWIEQQTRDSMNFMLN